MEQTKEQLQEEVLDILYNKSLVKPVWVTCSEVYWNTKNIKVTERSVREALDWLVKNEVVLYQGDKYQISKREFLEISKRKEMEKKEVEEQEIPQPKANPAPVSIQPEDDSFKKAPHRSNLFFVIIALIAFLLSGILVGILIFNHYAKDQNDMPATQQQTVLEPDSINLSAIQVRTMGYIKDEYTVNRNFKNLSRSLSEQKGINGEILDLIRTQQEQINSLVKYNEQHAHSLEQYQKKMYIYLWIISVAVLVGSSLLVAWYGRRN